MIRSYAYWPWLLVLVWAWVWSARALVFDELTVFDEPASYRVETTVLLNDVSKKDREVGYKIMATLHVAPVWAQLHEQFLLKFSLHSPKLYLKGKHIMADYIPYGSIWDQYSDTTFYAHWIDGLIEVAYMDLTELPDVINYKKSLLSLFQFPLAVGEHNETDASGACRTAYERRARSFRKIKVRCEGDAALRAARRVTRYTLDDARGALREVYGEELLLLGDASLGLKARAWQRLAADAPPAAPPRAASLRDALRAVPDRLQPTLLAMRPAEPARVFHDEEPAAAWRRAAEALGAAHEREGGGGGAAAARALPPALRAARRAPAAQLGALLAATAHEDHHALAGLCRLLGLAATRGSHAAARDFLQLHAPEPQVALAHAYLAAVALADRPDEWVVLEVLRLGEEARDSSVAESALLAAGAAASRVAAAPAAQAVRDALARSLARCKEEECRTVRIRALGNLRRADTVDLLLEQAERGRTEPRAALAAVQALAAVPEAALRFVHLDRLGEVALDERSPLEVRGAALDLTVRRRAALPAPLARLAYRLHERGPHELRRVLWQRLDSLAPRHEAAARLPHMLEPHMRGWDARAHAGTSAVLQRATGWAAGGWRTLLDSVQVARAGLLRHSAVRLLAEDAANRTEDVLAVEVWTRGLEAFGGGDTEPEEEASGGLQLVVGGARSRDVTLFNGQAELLGHVWAGTASTPTPVLRALRELTAREALVPLAAGVQLHAARRGALALALDAQAQVSLWYRSARTQLDLRAAAHLELAAALHTAWGTVHAHVDTHAEPTLQILANLDFYDEVRFCVHVISSDHEYRRNVTLESRQGARRLRVRRARAERVRAAGRTLALGRLNDRTCRTLRAADEGGA